MIRTKVCIWQGLATVEQIDVYLDDSEFFSVAICSSCVEGETVVGVFNMLGGGRSEREFLGKFGSTLATLMFSSKTLIADRSDANDVVALNVVALTFPLFIRPSTDTPRVSRSILSSSLPASATITRSTSPLPKAGGVIDYLFWSCTIICALCQSYLCFVIAGYCCTTEVSDRKRQSNNVQLRRRPHHTNVVGTPRGLSPRQNSIRSPHRYASSSTENPQFAYPPSIQHYTQSSSAKSLGFIVDPETGN